MNARFLPFALVALFAHAVLAQDYAIQLQRPLKPGDEEKLSVTSKQSQSVEVTSDGIPRKDTKSLVSIQFDGVEKIMEVDAKGKESKIMLTVDKFTLTTNGGNPAEILPKGSIIACSAGNKHQVYEMNGKAVAPALADALDLVVDLARGEPSDDEVFGTREREKKGDSWDVNGPLARADIEGAGGGAVFSNIKGRAMLEDVTGGAMKIAIHISGGAKPRLGPALTLDQSSMQATFAGTYPLDTAKYQTEDSGDIITSFTAHSTASSDARIVMKSTIEQSLSRKFTPVK